MKRFLIAAMLLSAAPAGAGESMMIIGAVAKVHTLSAMCGYAVDYKRLDGLIYRNGFAPNDFKEGGRVYPSLIYLIRVISERIDSDHDAVCAAGFDKFKAPKQLAGSTNWQGVLYEKTP